VTRPARKPLASKRLLMAAVVLLTFIVLVVPAPENSESPEVLTSYSVEPTGARGIHDVLDRLGFTVQRWLRPMRQKLDTTAVYLVLDPSVELTANEVHNLLNAVRAGAGLIVSPQDGTRLSDSLRLVSVPAQVEPEEPPRFRDITAADPDERLLRFVLRRPRPRTDSTSIFTPPANAQMFVSVQTTEGPQPVIVGLPFGRGRMVVAGELVSFSNAVVRESDAGVRVVRMIEWIMAGRTTRPIVFDEYHHGFGRHADLLGVTRRALSRTTSGRTVLQLITAGLVLLLALGVRPIRPQPRTHIERRSALEHVGALARAYAAVRAAPRATRLLVRGLRRRHGGLRSRRDEASYLRSIADQKPEVAADVQKVVSVLDGTAPGQNADLTAAILRIERAITS
jgi:uncharacterized protein DUF4350